MLFQQFRTASAATSNWTWNRNISWSSLLTPRKSFIIVLLFNTVTGSTLCASSDALAQYMERKYQVLDQQQTQHQQSESLEHHKNSLVDSCLSSPEFRRWVEEFHWARCCSAAVIGGVFGGFVYPFAYSRLDTLWIGTGLLPVIQKSISEIATVGIFSNSISMAFRGLLVGRDNKEVVQHLYQEMPWITLNDAMVWLPYNMVAFAFIPTVIRPTTTAFMEACWQTYISLRSNNYDPNPEALEDHRLKPLSRRMSVKIS